MKKKIIWLVVSCSMVTALLFASCTPATTVEEERTVCENLVAQIDFSSWIPGTLKVSPDNQRVAYVAKVTNKWCVVVDGIEGEEYDGIIGEGKIVFNSSCSLHYLALKGDNVYLRQESIR